MSVTRTLRSARAAATSLFSVRRLALIGAPALLFSAPLATAQQQILDVQKVPSASKYAGTYHAHTGTWTRRTNQFGPALTDIIYTNTAQSSYFSTAGADGGFAPGSENFDEGGLPGLTNGNPFSIGPNRDTYRVNGFQIGYCDTGPAQSGGWEISFFEDYAPCSLDTDPITRIAVTGLPAGAVGCWVVDIDLTGGQEFDIGADGGDGWQNDDSLDSFGWSFRYIGSDPGGNGAGFQLAGDPDSTGGVLAGFGTYYADPSPCLGTTGYLIGDSWWIEDPTGTNSGCFFFGGYSNPNGCNFNFNPHASYQIQIVAEALGGMQIGTDYCSSTPNSTGAMTTLTASGSDVAADDSVELLSSNIPAGSFGFYITSQTQGSVAFPGGSAGNLCVIGDVGRFTRPGQVKAAGADGTLSLSTTLGEWSTASIPQATPPLTYAATTGLTSNFQLWHRDVSASGGGSNFSNGLSITWL